MGKQMRNSAVFFLNGERQEVSDDRAFMMLADFLRYQKSLPGTKIVCAEGDCGACTVLYYRPLENNRPIFLPLNSCIAMVAQLDGCHVVTVEGLKDKGALSPVQKAIVSCHGSQCGYCTPGFAMAMTGIFEDNPQNLTEQRIKNCLTGNLCRCTGYQPLIEAALSVDTTKMSPLSARYGKPEMIRALKECHNTAIHIAHDGREFFAPTQIEEACRIKASMPDVKIISGATDLGVQINKQKANPDRFMSLHLISELYDHHIENGRIKVGARASLSVVRDVVKDTIPELYRFLNIFASPQIKNVATLVGNVANASPIGDTIPFLMVADGVAHARSSKGERRINFSDLFQGYKTLSLRPDEIITAISFAVPAAEHELKLCKVSKRKDLDISTINSAFLFRMASDECAIEDARIAFGGVEKTVMRLTKTEQLLSGATLTPKLVDQAVAMITNEIAPITDLRGSKTYRTVLAEGLFRKFCEDLRGKV